MSKVYFLPSNPDDTDIAALVVAVADEPVAKHQGPGPHKGTGTSQMAHGRGGGEGGFDREQGYTELGLTRPEWATPEMDAAIALLAADGGAFSGVDNAYSDEFPEWVVISPEGQWLPGPKSLRHLEAERVIGRVVAEEAEMRKNQRNSELWDIEQDARSQLALLKDQAEFLKVAQQDAIMDYMDAEAKRLGYADRFQFGKAEPLNFQQHLLKFDRSEIDARRRAINDEMDRVWGVMSAAVRDANDNHRLSFIEVLGEIRPMGRGDDQKVMAFGWTAGNAPGTFDEKMGRALDSYPSDWIRDHFGGGPMDVEFANGQRGGYVGGHQVGTSRMFLDRLAPEADYIHEMAHRMEYVRPSVRYAEWAFYWARVGNDYVPVPLSDYNPGAYTVRETTRPDEFPNPYVGKDYGSRPDSHYEVLSMGMERDFGLGDKVGFDADHRNFVLGVLVTV